MRQRAAASLLYQSQYAEPAFRNLQKSIFLKIVGRILAFYNYLRQTRLETLTQVGGYRRNPQTSPTLLASKSLKAVPQNTPPGRRMHLIEAAQLSRKLRNWSINCTK